MFSKVLTGNFDVHEFINSMELSDTEDESLCSSDEENDETVDFHAF